MTDQGRYKKLPRPESIDTLIQYLSTKDAVFSVSRESEQVIYIERTKHPPLRVYMTNIYIVGLADVYDIVAQVDELDGIVTMSAWNGYTGEAKAACKKQGIGLFKFNEILGAVYYHGNQYLDYLPPDERDTKQQPGWRA